MSKTTPQNPQRPQYPFINPTPLTHQYDITVRKTGEKLVFEHYANGQLFINGMICGWAEERLRAEDLRLLAEIELAFRKHP